MCKIETQMSAKHITIVLQNGKDCDKIDKYKKITNKAFYVYTNQTYTEYTITQKVYLTEQNIELITAIEGAIKNETYRDTRTFDHWLKSFRSRKRSDSRDNVNASRSTPTRGHDGVDGGARGGKNGNASSNSDQNSKLFKVDPKTNLPIGR